jgi:hypothetical protein
MYTCIFFEKVTQPVAVKATGMKGKEDMPNQTVTHDLYNPGVNVFDEVPIQDTHQACLPDAMQCNFLGVQDIPLDQIAGNPGEKGAGKSRFNLLDILFPDRGVEAYRRLEGDDMTPIVVYKSGNGYCVADGSSRLEVARHMGKAFILAEVWEYACR